MLRCTCWIALCSAFGSIALSSDAQDDQETGGTSVADERAAASEEASELLAELTCHLDSAATADVLPESVLNWSNPDVGRVYGDVFLWVEEGRPVAAASIYRWFHPYDSLTIEFSSMSGEQVSVDQRDETIWHARDGGITWTALKNSRPPASSRNLRLTQFKQIARRFSAELVDARTDDDGVERTLRLLPQPIYRYPESASGADGAVFAMVIGTDPELLIVVESDERDWRYSVVRMNRDALDVQIDDQRVVSFPHIADRELFDTTRPYCCIAVTYGE